jgi:DNA-directed RNA polymerase beta subunit
MLSRLSMLRTRAAVPARSFSSTFSEVENFVSGAFERAGLTASDAADDISKLNSAKILNMTLLHSMSAENFKEIGVSMGAQKAITAALAHAPKLERTLSRGGQAQEGRKMGSM